MRVAVFTGSQAGPPAHRAAAAAFATELARAGVGIVYGGGHVGSMGVVADAALAAGGEVVGVIPQHLVDDELAHPGLPRLEVVTTMHERKARMAELADVFVALPGAAGTGGRRLPRRPAAGRARRRRLGRRAARLRRRLPPLAAHVNRRAVLTPLRVLCRA